MQTRALITATVAVVAAAALGACTAQQPEPGSDKVTEARAASADELEATMQGIVDAAGFTTVATQKGSYDTCYSGQNNFKVKDGYQYRCEHSIMWYVGSDGDVNETLRQVDRALGHAGWSSGWRLSKVVDYEPERVDPLCLPDATYRKGDLQVRFVPSLPARGGVKCWQPSPVDETIFGYVNYYEDLDEGELGAWSDVGADSTLGFAVVVQQVYYEV